MSYLCRKCGRFFKKGDQVIKVESFVMLDNEEDMNPDFKILHYYHKSCYE